MQTCRAVSSIVRAGWSARVLACLTAYVSLAAVCTDASGSQLILLDGTRQTVEIKTIRDDGTIVLHGTETPQRLDGLRQIVRDTKTHTAKQSRVIVDLVAGGLVRGDDLRIANETCTIEGTLVGDIELPLDAIVAIRIQPSQVDDQLADRLTGRSHEADQLYVMIDGIRETVSGLVESLDSSQVVFQFEDRQRSISRDRLIAIAIASAGPTKTDLTCFFHLLDGSAFWGKIVKLEAGQLTLGLPGDTSAVIPWERIARIVVRSPRLTFLSDLEPIRAEHRPIVTSTRRWQRDKNVMGLALTLGSKSYEKGIGVASESHLTFDVKGRFSELCTTIGIDARTQGRGDCVFVVRGDGQELVRERITAQDMPRDLKLTVAGIQQLELIVEVGEELDLSDHANWCDARLIRD